MTVYLKSSKALIAERQQNMTTPRGLKQITEATALTERINSVSLSTKLRNQGISSLPPSPCWPGSKEQGLYSQLNVKTIKPRPKSKPRKTPP
jgi:hypothetical protein